MKNKIIEIKEEVQIEGIILEKGDKIKVLESILTVGEMPTGNKINIKITNMGDEIQFHLLDNDYPYDTLYIKTKDLLKGLYE